MSPHRRVPRWLWDKIATPKWLTIITTIGYLIALAVGGYAMINQPSSIEGAIGELAMYSISVLLVVAGIIGAPTALWGEWKIERYAALLALLATALYVAIIRTLHIEGTGQPSPPGRAGERGGAGDGIPHGVDLAEATCT